MGVFFDPDCRRCERLAVFLDEVGERYPGYHARPVPAFGPERAGLLIVGLAPGMHGANATGRPFTGDHAGILLYQTLHRFGFASADASISSEDGLTLSNCRITNAVKCLPPQNKPLGSEVSECRRFLDAEIASLEPASVVLALGGIAHRAIVAGAGLRQKEAPFAHAAEHVLPTGVTLIDSYHCSRYNTQTKRLTPAMFDVVFERARALLDAKPPSHG